MILRRIGAFFVSIVLLLSSLSITSILALADDSNSSDYSPVAHDGYLGAYIGAETDVTLPQEVNGIKMFYLYQTFYNRKAVVSVVVPDGYTGMSANVFYGASSLRSVSLPETLETLGDSCFRTCASLETVNIPKKITSIPKYAFRGCTNANLVIDIQSTSIESVGSYAFRDVVGTIKVYSQAMYDLISANATTAKVILESGNIPENPLDYTNLDKALADGKAVDTSNYTEATVTALTDAIAAGKAVKENTSATQTDIDNAAKAITDAIAGLVVKLDYTAMDAAIAEAEDIIANHSGEYTEESIADLKFGLDTAKAYRGRDTNQDTIDEVTRVYLTLKIKNLVKIDIAAMLGDLKAVIEDAEAIDESEYTEESYQVLADAITAAKAMNEGTNYKDILAAQSSIKNAVSKLVLKPLEEFVRVYKGGAVAEITSGKADASMAGATSVRITFNCASDVSYNQYSSIEVKAIVSGTESYEKFIGKGDYTTGTNGWTETLTLTNAIAEGQSYEVTAFTYAWANASDYVYAVSKVEFLDAEGNVVAKVTANTQALSELKQAIEEAEKVDTDLYTEDTVKVLLDKIGVAKIITEKSTVAEIKAATEAITKAIEDLELKVRYENISGTINVSDGDESTEMTVTVTAQDGTETSVTAKSMGSYSIENIEEGEYTITISGGKYAPRSYEVVVSEGSITQDADLNPYGDINGDGKVTTADVGMANSHAKGVTELTGYKYTCANVNTGDEITTADVGMINSHAKSVDTLW